MTTLFISDLHLDGTRPDISTQFLDFLEREGRRAEALYILGDLFEAWIGDDDPDPDKRRVIQGLRSVTSAGVKTFFIHGNRDFLIGKAFGRETGIELLEDGTVIDLYGRRVLLMHGDLLCIDDHAYQRLRRIVRNPIVQFVMRSLTLRRRQKLAERMRAGSKEHIKSMDIAAPQIMDVNQEEVRRTCNASVSIASFTATRIARRCTRCRSMANPPCASCSGIGMSKAACCAGISADSSWRGLRRQARVEPELRIRRRRQFRFDLRQMLQSRAPILLTGAMLGQSQIHPIVAGFRSRQAVVEIAQRSLQSRR